MSYHSTSPTTTRQSTTNAQGKIAPAGYHYMPNGVLMLDSEMEALSGILITDFEMDFFSALAAGESRPFNVRGSFGATFEMEIKNEDGSYYNFFTRTFQTNKSVLSKAITSGSGYKGSVQFPVVTDNDHYDISLTATGDTKHNVYSEVRFGDGSVDINSTTGSNSLLIKKIIYQYVDLVLTINPFSPTGAIPGTAANDTIAVSSGTGLDEAVAFSTTFTVANDKALRIIKQPTHLDILSFVKPVVGAAPINIPGENIYPTARAAFLADDINGAITSGAVVRMDNTDLSAVIKVGDKITTSVTTDTVNGARDTSAVAVTMDTAVATKMAVGDRVTGNAALDAGIFTVASLDSTNVFSISSAVAIADEVTLTFSSKINRSLTTVTVVETSSTDTVNGARDASGVAVTMDAAVATKMAVGDIVTGNTALDAGVFTVAAIASTNVFNLSSAVAIADGVTLTFRTATDFTMSQAIQFRDNAPLTFFPQKNYRWPITNFAHILKPGFVFVPVANLSENVALADYKDTTTAFAGTEQEKVYTNYEVDAVNTLAQKPVVTNGEVTTQAGAIVFDSQQVLELAGDTLKAGGYGQSEIFSVYGYDVIFSDLAVALTPITTTTTAASAGGFSTSVVLASMNGILNSVSTVSGIGIDPTVVDPTVASGAGAAGAGTIVLSAGQSLESGVTLSFANTGLVATISGSIQVLRAGTASQTLRIDIEKLLTIT